VNAPDGRDALEVKCKSDRANCLEEAGADCGASGYYVMSEDSHSGGWAIDLMPGPVPWWTMLVRCGRAPEGYVAPPVAAASVTPPAPSEPGSPSTISNSNFDSRAPQVRAGCTSDLACPVGQKCVKDSYALEGVCAEPVNQYGTPQYAAPSGGSIGLGQGQCQFTTQCPLGFECIKTSGGVYGNCMR